MELILSVLADPQGANMLKHTKLFKVAGGTLGRADSNDWVLPDPERVVSSRHAQVVCHDGQFFLIDHSTNGTYHNQSPEPVGKGNQVALRDGDVIAVGDYQLKVSLRQPAQDTGLPKGLGEADFLDSSDRTTFSSSAAAKMQSAQDAQELDSWLEPSTPAAGRAHSGEWGYLSAAGTESTGEDFLGQPAVTDPLKALDGLEQNSLSADPMAGLLGNAAGHGQAAWSADDGDAWWKEGSEQDHAPADQHAMQIAAQQAPAPRGAMPQSVEGADGHGAHINSNDQNSPETNHSAPPIPPSQQQAPQSPPPPAHNPFADSFAAVADAQVAGAPGFDAPVATPPAAPTPTPPAPVTPPSGFADASQQFAPLQSPVSNVQPQPQPQPQPQQGASSLARCLGLTVAAAQSQVLDQQGAAIIRQSIERLIDLLRARNSIKNELRVQRTMIQTEANNPLKFSATAQDALNAMFAGNGAFLSPEESVRDSFDDLSDHQVAVLAGMRAGYDSMLRFFSPENIERRMRNQGGVFASKNARNWEGFQALYRSMVSDPEACYRNLFGEEFASTYESQLAELKNARNLSGRH